MSVSPFGVCLSSSRGRPIARITLFIFVAVAAIILLSGSVAAFEPETQTASELEDSVVYGGQELNVDLTNSGLNISGGDEVYLVRYTDNPEYTLEDPYQVNNDTVVTDVKTGELTLGETFAFADSPTTGGYTTGDFTLINTTYSAEWRRNTATTSDQIDVDIDSSRSDRFALTISADGLQYAELAALFGGDATIQENREYIPFEQLGYDPEDTTVQDVIDDNYITITGWRQDDGDLQADFERLSNQEGFPSRGDYSFEFVISSTGNQDTSGVFIGETDEDAQFSQPVYGGAAGDLPSVEFRLRGNDYTFVQISDGEAFADVLYVRLDDPSQEASIRMNTRLLGTDHRSFDGEDVYQTRNIETLVSAYHDGPSERFDTVGSQPFDDGQGGGTASPTIGGRPIFGAGDGDAVSYEEYLRTAEFIEQDETMADQLNRPLRPVEYSVTVAGLDNIDSGEGIFDAQEGKPTNPIASAALVLQEPAINDVSIYRGPPGAADTMDDVPAAVTGRAEAENVSLADRLVIEYEIAGIFGTIAAGGQGSEIDSERITDSVNTRFLQNISESNQDITFEVANIDFGANQEPIKIDLTADGSATFAVIDYDTNRIFIVADLQNSEAFTDSLRGERSTFKAVGEYGTADETETPYQFQDGDPINGAFSVDGQNPNHPYVSPNNEVSVTETFTVGPSKISFADEIQGIVPLQNGTSVVVSATTNIAQGRDGRMEIRSQNTNDTTVAAGATAIEDGQISGGPFNLHKFGHGTPVEITIDIDGLETRTFDGVVVENTNDVVINVGDIRTGVDDPTSIQEGTLVSEVVSWGDPPPTPVDSENAENTENREADQSETNQANRTENTATEQSDEETAAQPDGTQTGDNTVDRNENEQTDATKNTNESDPTQSDPTQSNSDDGGVGLAFVPVLGVALLSTIVGGAAAVILN